MNIEQAHEVLINLQQSVTLTGKDHEVVKQAIATLYEAAKNDSCQK